MGKLYKSEFFILVQIPTLAMRHVGIKGRKILISNIEEESLDLHLNDNEN